MFKCWPGFPVRIRNFLIVLPFTDKEGFSVHLRCDFTDMLDMATLHRENQVGLAKHIALHLSGSMRSEFQSVVLQNVLGGLVHGVTY